jgi:putative addiction module killer protein
MRVRQTEAFSTWLESIKDRSTKGRILMRIDRLAHGNPGQHRHLTHGVSELKIDVGPGYRAYYAQRGSELLLLLAGGNKSSQQRDIALAIELLAHIQES